MRHEAHRKERFIITAIEIIDELGIQKLTTREIARRQGVSEAALFKHYKSKSELLLVTLEYFDQFNLELFKTASNKDFEPAEKIRYVIETYSEYYENYPAITSLMQIFDVLGHETELKDNVKDILNNGYKIMELLLVDVQKANEIRSDIDCGTLSKMIFGFCREICLNWRLNGYNFSLRKRVQSTLDIFLDSLKAGVN